jgi:hypothetical protein
MKAWIVPLVAAIFVAGTVQSAAAQGQGQGQGQGQAKGQGKDNRGEVASECNHRANERKLKGQERQDFVEWCESRGARYKYDDTRYDGEKNCYQKANNQGLTGDKRANFLDKCLTERGGDDFGGKAPVKKKD